MRKPADFSPTSPLSPGLCFRHVNRYRSTEKTTHPRASTAHLPSFPSTACHPDSSHRGNCSNKTKWERRGRLHFNDQGRIPSDAQSKGETQSSTLTLERRPQLRKQPDRNEFSIKNQRRVSSVQRNEQPGTAGANIFFRNPAS